MWHFKISLSWDSNEVYISKCVLGYTEVDHYKLERKRERNRVAATKCRMRKMERIAQLDREVSELKSQNTTLGQVGKP